MVILHHEVEIDFPDGQATEKQRATLLDYGRIKNEKTTTSMALTVGVPAAIGALLLLAKKIKTTGILRPIYPEVYEPGLGGARDATNILSSYTLAASVIITIGEEHMAAPG